MFAPRGEAVNQLGEGIKLPVINGLGRTNRIDNWWSQPLVMGTGLTLALIYTFWRLFIYSTDDTISYTLEGSVVMSPIFSPNVLNGICLDYPLGTTLRGLMQQFLFCGYHLVLEEHVITCEEYTTEPFSPAQSHAGLTSLISIKNLDTKERKGCSFSIICIGISFMQPC